MSEHTPAYDRDDITLCREETRAHAKSFYFASHVLPREKRDAAYAVYAFCRLVDNTVDNAPNGDAAAITRALDALRVLVDRAYEGDETLPPRFRALSIAVRANNVPKRYFQELIAGVEMDLTIKRFDTFTDLDLYCYHVASVVGLIMTHIFGATETSALRYAAALGTAMQLTNILRDVAEDLRLGRVYLPQDELRAFGITEDDLAAGTATPAFVRMMEFQARRARSYYRLAEHGLALLPDDGSRYCVRLMSNIYEGILDEIVRLEYNVFNRRAYVSTRKKLGIAVSSYMARVPRLLHGSGHSATLFAPGLGDDSLNTGNETVPGFAALQSSYNDTRESAEHMSERT